MDDLTKFSDDAMVRFVIAPGMLLIGAAFLSNYKRFIVYAYFRSQGRMPGAPMLFLFRMGGSFWVIAGLTLVIGLW